MFHKIAAVKPLAKYQLLVRFVDGSEKKYNVARLFGEIEAFKTLRTAKGLFEQVRVDKGGYGIVWNDDLDLSASELYKNGTRFYGAFPPPEALKKVAKKQTITIMLDKDTLLFFKNIAKKHGAKYQTLINEVLSVYSKQHAKKAS
jgi:hypothetical protein